MRKRFQSFLFAIRGLKTVFTQEKNFQIQALAALVVFVLMFIFPLVALERIMLTLVMSLVLILELTNTALEYTLDIFRPRIHPTVGVVKDIMAGAVLVAATSALVVGMLIFWPYILPILTTL